MPNSHPTQEVLEIEADLLPDAFQQAANACCTSIRLGDYRRPARARIEFYGVKMLIRQDENRPGNLTRKIVYTFLVVYEDNA